MKDPLAESVRTRNVAHLAALRAAMYPFVPHIRDMHIEQARRALLESQAHLAMVPPPDVPAPPPSEPSVDHVLACRRFAL